MAKRVAPSWIPRVIRVSGRYWLQSNDAAMIPNKRSSGIGILARVLAGLLIARAMTVATTIKTTTTPQANQPIE